MIYQVTPNTPQGAIDPNTRSRPISARSGFDLHVTLQCLSRHKDIATTQFLIFDHLFAGSPNPHHHRCLWKAYDASHDDGLHLLSAFEELTGEHP